MSITQDNRAIRIVMLTMAAFNGIFLSANGLFMLVAPQLWYDFVPGVTDTGLFNQHSSAISGSFSCSSASLSASA